MRFIIQFDTDLLSLWFLLFAVILFHSSKGVDYDGEKYGTEWVYFADMNGNKHYVDMTVSLDHYRMMDIGFRMIPKYKANFWLYTRRNVYEYQLLVANNLPNDLYFEVGKPLVMVTHGWFSDGNGNSTQLVKNAYLEQDDVNVVVVDWGDEAKDMYTDVVLKLPKIAEKISELVTALSKRFSFDGSVVHLIGHSLGAHLMSYAGLQLKKNGFIVVRLTGLDPARPFFEVPMEAHGISKESAAFVDIIHTNVGVLGIVNARGHADFYPDGGINQTSCCATNDEIDILSDMCDHSCSYIYYEKSIKYNVFNARKCDTYKEFLWGICDNNEEDQMGEPTSPYSRGKFYLNVEKLPPNISYSNEQ